MDRNRIVDRDEWLAARKRLLEREKEFTRQRDALARERRALPRVRVDKDYRFDTEQGPKSLGDLFGPMGQLVVYHFMFGPDWKEGCKSCSFWADSFDGASRHLAARDLSFVAVSRAPLPTLLAFRERMGWGFPWASSLGSDFNRDFGVTFEDGQNGSYNYAPRTGGPSELPGASVFLKGPDGSILHSYSTYARGLDWLNAAYAWLDLTPKGRDEDSLPWSMAWVKLHDTYGAPERA